MTVKIKNNNMNKILYYQIIILLVVLITISSFFIYKQIKEDNEQESIFNELNEIIQDDKPNNLNNNSNENTDININELYNINKDLIGWIKINNTDINYPVMQTKNNPDYYLRRNFNKEYSSWGTPYLEEECNMNSSSNLVIYGHHINGNKMFGELEKYKDKNFYESHKYI